MLQNPQIKKKKNLGTNTRKHWMKSDMFSQAQNYNPIVK